MLPTRDFKYTDQQLKSKKGEQRYPKVTLIKGSWSGYINISDKVD